MDKRRGPKKDLAGRRFDLLVAIEPTDERRFKCVVWKCVCDCGKTHFVPSKNLLNGNSGSCGCRTKENQRRACRYPEGESAFNRLYRTYGYNARDAKREFLISKDKFRELTKSNCFYCGAQPFSYVLDPPSNGSYTYNGLDRVNTLGNYTLDNVVPCCKYCNIAKRAMSQQEFARWASRLYNHWAEDFVD